MLCAIDLGE